MHVCLVWMKDTLRLRQCNNTMYESIQRELCKQRGSEQMDDWAIVHQWSLDMAVVMAAAAGWWSYSQVTQNKKKNKQAPAQAAAVTLAFYQQQHQLLTSNSTSFFTSNSAWRRTVPRPHIKKTSNFSWGLWMKCKAAASLSHLSSVLLNAFQYSFFHSSTPYRYVYKWIYIVLKVHYNPSIRVFIPGYISSICYTRLCVHIHSHSYIRYINLQAQ